MLTDWLIYLDYLEENNCNTSFLRLVTPIIFNASKNHNYKYDYGDGLGNYMGNGYGNSYLYLIYNLDNDYDTASEYGNFQIDYLNYFDEEH